MSTPQRILVVDDDDIFRGQLTRAFERRGLTVHAAQDHESALTLARQAELDAAVVDLRMDGPSGLVVLRDLLELKPELRVLILTGYGSIATAVDAVRLGATQYLQKPVDADEILAAFDRPPAPDVEAVAEVESTPSLDRVEWEHIQRVLADTGGNISEAARRLGLHRRSLQRKLTRYPPRE